MADKKFSQLTAAGVLAAADLLAISQSPFGAGSSKSILASDILTYVGQTLFAKAGGNITGAVTIATNKVTLNTDGTSVFAGFMTCPFYLCEFPDASTNTAPAVSEFEHQLTAGTAAANFGVSVDFSGNSTTTARSLLSRLTARWTDATHATRTSQIRLFLSSSATLTEVMRWDASNILIPAGNLIFTDNTFDIGASAATRPRTGYFGTSVVAPRYIVDSGNVNAQTGTSYTLVASDNGKVVTLSNAGSITLTVPSGLGAGFSCTLIQIGAGQVTVAASSTTINSYLSLLKLSGQHAAATLYAYVANTFNLSGNLSA